MKVLSVNDIHASDHPPSSCTSAYREDILNLLWQTAGVADRFGVSAVCWPGDVFHSKTPHRTSHELVNLVADVVRAYPCPVYITPGNHDIQYDDITGIDKQPLGVLYRAGARPLIGRCQEFPQLYGVPWQQQWDNATVSRALKDWREDGKNTTGGFGLVVAHAPLYPPGLELPYENFPAARWAEEMNGRSVPACCVYGHVHEYHGVWELDGVRFCNVGALSRGSLHEHNLTRQIKVAVWDSRDGMFTEVPLDAKPAEQVFRLREKQQATDAAGKLDQFLTSIGSAQLEVLSAEAVLEHVRSLKLGKDVEDEMAELLDWAAHQS